MNNSVEMEKVKFDAANVDWIAVLQDLFVFLKVDHIVNAILNIFVMPIAE